MKQVYVLRVYWKNGTWDETRYDSWDKMKNDIPKWLDYSVWHLSDLVLCVGLFRQMEG